MRGAPSLPLTRNAHRQTAALTQWEAAFAHMSCDYFCLFRESLQGGHSNFITGAGGFLQNIVQGWAGVRVSAEALTLTGPTLPPTVTSVTLRSLQFRGTSFTVRFDATTISFALASERPAVPLRVVGADGRSHTLSVQESPTLPLKPRAAFKVEPAHVLPAPPFPGLPDSPRRTCDVREFGAKADGKTNDAASINRAIQSCQRIVFKGGHTFVTGSVRLKSMLTIVVEPDAVIRAAQPGIDAFDHIEDNNKYEYV